MLCPARCPPTFGSGPACCNAPPRVPPGGITTASLSWASWRNCRLLSGICSTSRVSMTSLISAVVACSSGALTSTVTASLIGPIDSVNSSCRIRPSSSVIPVWVTRWKPGSSAVTSHTPVGSAGRKTGPRRRSPARW